MFILKKKYFFIIESIKDIELKNIKNFSKISIIYRNFVLENLDKIKKFRLECKSRKIPFFVANNVVLMKAVKADGLYVSAHNKKLNIINLKRQNFNIIGAAHNIKEINLKKLQGCSNIFLSCLFKTAYKNKKDFLGVIKFNLITKLIKTSLVPLGGITLKNLNKLKFINCEAIGVNSLIKQKPKKTLQYLR